MTNVLFAAENKSVYRPRRNAHGLQGSAKSTSSVAWIECSETIALSRSYDKAMMVDAQYQGDCLRARRACSMESARLSKSLAERRAAPCQRSRMTADVLDAMCPRSRGGQA